MNRLIVALLLLPALAYARYEDLAVEDGPAPLPEINLLFYIFGGLAVWCFLVWDEWRLLWFPLVLAVGCAVAAYGWGYDGLGFMAIATPVVAMLAGALGMFTRK